MPKKEFRFILNDDPEPSRIRRGVVVQEAGGLTIYVEGYNDDQPIAGLVLQDGKLKLLAFDEYGSEEPKTIEIEKPPATGDANGVNLNG
jgi:hypothetical protein